MQLNAFLSALMIMIMDVAFILFGWNRSILQVNKTIILVDREIHKQLPAFKKKKTWFSPGVSTKFCSFLCSSSDDSGSTVEVSSQVVLTKASGQKWTQEVEEQH